MKKIIATLMIMAMITTVFAPQTAYAEVTNNNLPQSSVGLKWEIKLGEGYSSAPTPPLLHNGIMYVGAGKKLYMINKETGAIIKSSPNLAGDMGYAMNPPVYGNGMIFISVGNGRIQALDSSSLQILWTSESRTGDTNCPLIFDKASGDIFTGTWMNKDDGGEYLCINGSRSGGGNIKWSVSHEDGFYWSGAYIYNNNIIFGSEQIYRTTDSTLYSVNKSTGDIVSTAGAIGNIRSTIVGEQNTAYALTQESKLYKISLNTDGSFDNVESVSVNGASTGKPTIYDGKIYFGSSSKSIEIYNLSDLTKVSSIPMPAYPQAEFLLSSGSDNSINIYSTYNKSPGGICHVKINGSNSVVNQNFFTPINTQFCTSPLICDADGTIYYKNDSCYLMAINSPDKIYASTPSVSSNSYNSLKISWGKMAGATSYEIFRSTSLNGTYSKIKSIGSSTNYHIDKGLKTGTKYYYKIQAKYTGQSGETLYSKQSAAVYAKPTLKKPSIKITAGKKKIKVTWKKVQGASGYVIYRSTKKKGKYKKVKTIKKGSTKSWTNKKLKSKKKYYYKVKAYRKVSGKKVYSAYSGIKYKKVK